MDQPTTTAPYAGLFSGLLRILGLRQAPNEATPGSDLETSFVIISGDSNFTPPHRLENSKGNSYLVEDWSKFIGEGSFGVVYSCQDLFGQEYILKCLKNFSAVEADWNKEQNILFSLFHPNIIRIFDAFQFEDYYYLVMEKADGDLRSYLAKNGKLSSAEVIHIGAQIFSALAHIHSQNVIHRDLHIDNILYLQNGPHLSIKIADFGISKKLFSEDEFATSIVGRDWDYCPELVTEGHATKKSDLYQTGIVLYYCLTGEMAIGASDGICEDVTVSGLARERALALGTPIGDVVANLLHVDPNLRYADALTAWMALKDANNT